jgi:hypothetical protein
MGLDTYAARIAVDFMEPGLDESAVDDNFGCTPLDRRALRRAQKRREAANDGYCVFEGNYFRGKLYTDLVRFVTRVSLYQAWIPPETVNSMAAAFARRDAEAIIRGFRRSRRQIYDHNVTEVADLREFLKVCARRGLGLVGSW